MNTFQEMHRKVCSSPHYDQMQRFAAPLNDHFGINHFWYYKVTSSGHYSFLGTHAAWTEFCFDNIPIHYFRGIRHPDVVPSGLQLMKLGANDEFKNTLDTAWKKFGINFNINVVARIPEGIEGFGFATRYNEPSADERLLNELPLLTQFTKLFRDKNKKIFEVLADNQVDLATEFGSVFYEGSQESDITMEREKFLRKIGYGFIFSLSLREKEVLKLIVSGYPASFIAEQLQIKTRTVETYIETLKHKLSCYSKVELIKKAQEILPYLSFF